MKGSSILPKQCVLENVGLKLTLAFELQRWAWLQLNSWIWASGERHAHTHTHHSHAHSIQKDSHFYYRDNLLLSPKQNSCEPAKKLCHFFYAINFHSCSPISPYMWNRLNFTCEASVWAGNFVSIALFLSLSITIITNHVKQSWSYFLKLYWIFSVLKF